MILMKNKKFSLIIILTLFNYINSFSKGINDCQTIQNDSIKKSLYINPINDVTLLLNKIDIGIQITKRVKEISIKEVVGLEGNIDTLLKKTVYFENGFIKSFSASRINHGKKNYENIKKQGREVNFNNHMTINEDYSKMICQEINKSNGLCIKLDKNDNLIFYQGYVVENNKELSIISFTSSNEEARKYNYYGLMIERINDNNKSKYHYELDSTGNINKKTSEEITKNENGKDEVFINDEYYKYDYDNKGNVLKKYVSQNLDGDFTLKSEFFYNENNIIYKIIRGRISAKLTYFD